MSQAIEIETDFAAAMQELSAQAATPPPASAELVPSLRHFRVDQRDPFARSTGRSLGGIGGTEFRVDSFPENRGSACRRIRESETVNQRLFDSLHEELINYRDNFVRDSLQKPFIRDLLVLFDDLSTLAGQFEDGGERRREPPRECALAQQSH